MREAHCSSEVQVLSFAFLLLESNRSAILYAGANENTNKGECDAVEAEQRCGHRRFTQQIKGSPFAKYLFCRWEAHCALRVAGQGYDIREEAREGEAHRSDAANSQLPAHRISGARDRRTLMDKFTASVRVAQGRWRGSCFSFAACERSVL